MSSKKSQTFVYGGIIILISNILVKVIGAFFRIPLTNMIGLDAMAYFNAAYSIYVSFYMISTAGIPVAISRMIASSNARENHREVRRIFRIAFAIFFVVGVLGTGIMIGYARQFAAMAGESMTNAYYAMIAIAPTLFFICLSSAYRGYFQGLQNMIPTAVSQIIEALGKLSIGLIVGWYCVSQGYENHMVAAYVILGVTIGVAAGMIYAFVAKQMYTRSETYRHEMATQPAMRMRSIRSLTRELVVTALPVAIASTIMGLINVVDTMTVVKRLSEIGLDGEIARQYYGAYTSLTVPLFNMPPNLIYPFAISVIPALSASITVRDFKKARSNMAATFRIAALIAVPCCFGLAALSSQVISFLYKNMPIDGTSLTAVDIAAPALSVMCVSIFCVSIIAITNSMLQAWRKERKTIIATVWGILVKIVSSYFLLGIPDFGVMGAAISSALGYFTIMFINMFYLIKCTGFFPRIRKTYLKPFLAGFCCAVCALASDILFTKFLPDRVATLGAIVVAAIVYLAVLVVTHGIYEDDVRMLPKGEKIAKVFKKYKIIK